MKPKTTKAIPPFIIRNGERVYLEPRPVDHQHTDLAKTFKAAKQRQLREAMSTPPAVTSDNVSPFNPNRYRK